MEPVVDGVGSFSKTQNYATVVGYNPSSASGSSRPPHPPSLKTQPHEGASSSSRATTTDRAMMKTACFPVDAVVNSKRTYSATQYNLTKEKSEFVGPSGVLDQTVETTRKEVSTSGTTMDHEMVNADCFPIDAVVNSEQSYRETHLGNSEFVGPNDVLDQAVEIPSQKEVSTSDTNTDHEMMKTACFRIDAVVTSEHSFGATQYYSNKGKSEIVELDDVLHQTVKVCTQKEISTSDTVSCDSHSVDKLENGTPSSFFEPMNIASNQHNEGFGPSTSQVNSQSGISFCPSPQYSFYSATQYVEAKQSFTNTEVSESGEISNSGDITDSRKTSIYRGSSGSDGSDESSSSSLSSTLYKPHKANDIGWEAIKVVRSRDGVLGFNNFRLLKRLGCGDIGSVYLSELTGTRSHFAMKVMDKAALESRKKLVRVQTEREILQLLDHPFLPTLYTHFETEKFACLVMEFCPGGDLHALRQRQPGKFFPEHAARFYVAEVLLALEYLHMLGIIYRDLKPENVLVREDGHIMLSDFDLSLRCAVSPTLVKFSSPSSDSKNSAYCIEPSCVIQPACIQPTCFAPRFLNTKKKDKKTKPKTEIFHHLSHLPELMAEPTSARSMSFVGTHEYLAPEIIKGEGHGSAVDWWTFGIFLYELLFGKTPFKGQGNRATLFNVVGQPLRFPEYPTVSFAARDLIRGLLVKEPQHRLAYRRGATEVKQHPFFQSVNWALIRCTSPPDVPKPFVMDLSPTAEKAPGVDVNPSGSYLEIDLF